MPHTSHTVEQALGALRLHVVEMGGLAIDQVSTSVRALLERDARLAEAVLSREATINNYDQLIERDSITYIALQQPVASDLRLVRGVTRTAIELERVGDEAKKIARFALHVADSGDDAPVHAVARYLKHMAELSVGLLRNAVRAADESDLALARAVIAGDRELNDEFETAMRQIISHVIEDQRFMQATIDTIFALKGLERVGDHATNIAEQVVYEVSGEMTAADAED
ncbi:MAG TPA: phosphate signaling complex protein PhoU [Steroidobacteraceae bacterium]|nr:phosphate signaling complex protein PhoU [Steroidobacteraceae bacterium]